MHLKKFTMRSNILSVNYWLRNVRHTPIFSPIHRISKKCSTNSNPNTNYEPKFETVFAFPLVKHIATLNKMKKYHIIGTTIAIPGCGLLETLGTLPELSFLAATYIGITGAILFSLASLPFRNAIGFLYISEDDKLIKMSIVDFWGRRRDRIIPVNDWTPLLDLKPTVMDAIYLSPQLSDGTKCKLFIKFGKVLNSTKMGNVLE